MHRNQGGLQVSVPPRARNVSLLVCCWAVWTGCSLALLSCHWEHPAWSNPSQEPFLLLAGLTETLLSWSCLPVSLCRSCVTNCWWQNKLLLSGRSRDWLYLFFLLPRPCLSNLHFSPVLCGNILIYAAGAEAFFVLTLLSLNLWKRKISHGGCLPSAAWNVVPDTGIVPTSPAVLCSVTSHGNVFSAFTHLLKCI